MSTFRPYKARAQLKNRAQSFLLMAALVSTRDLREITIDDWNTPIQIARLLRARRPLIEAKPTIIKAQVEKAVLIGEIIAIPDCACVGMCAFGGLCRLYGTCFK